MPEDSKPEGTKASRPAGSGDGDRLAAAERSDEECPRRPRARPLPFRRLAAFAGDLGVFAAWGAGLYLIFGVLGIGAGHWPRDPVGTQVCGFFLTTLPFGLYLGAMEAGEGRATIGKRLLGLRVRSLGGGRPTRGQVLRRTCVKLLPWELGHVVAHQLAGRPETASFPPFLWFPAVSSQLLVLVAVGLLFVGRGRSIHDLAAGTVVAMRAPSRARD